VARFKPNCPIIGCTMSDRVANQINLMWGVTPLLLDRAETADALIANAVKEAQRAGLVREGDKVVITAGVPLGITGMTNMIRVVEV